MTRNLIDENGENLAVRAFSVAGLSGYHANAGKVTLFLDRRLNARSLTLPVEKLGQLAEMAGDAA